MRDRAQAAAPAGPTAALATIAGNLYLVLGSLFFGLLAMLTGWIPPRGDWMIRCARAWSRGLLAVSGIRLRVEQTQPLDPRARYVFMANHQSLFDIPVLLATLPGQVRFLAKKSLFHIPIFGWALAIGGFIPVDRGDRRQARAVFATAARRLEQGNSILIFPEQTRSRDGALLPFRGGGFLIALRSGVPIVPVGIRGTLDVRPRGRLAIRPGRVQVRYGVPIDVAGYQLAQKAELTAEVRRRVAALAGAEAAERTPGC